MAKAVRSRDQNSKQPRRKIPARRTHAREAWREARRQSDFSLFQPHLKKVVGINRQMADYWGYQESRYDALADEYEPGVRASQLRELFDELRPAIGSVLGPALERSAAIPPDLMQGNFPVAAQQALNREVAEAIVSFRGRAKRSRKWVCGRIGSPGSKLKPMASATSRFSAC